MDGTCPQEVNNGAVALLSLLKSTKKHNGMKSILGNGSLTCKRYMHHMVRRIFVCDCDVYTE